MTTVVRMVDGAVSLGGRPVLRGIDLSVAPGEVVAVLGANGSGKSTLVRSLLGLVPTTRGEVLLFETSLARFRQWHRIGFVPQRATAAGGVPASVTEVVASGRLSRQRLLQPTRRADRDAVRQALATVGLDDRARDNVSTLSGGQQQRVLIARALAGEPELFILDEPTAGVDAANQRALAETLELLVARGATVILVAHELGPIAPLVTRSVVMRDGRIVHDGPPDTTDADHDHGHHHHLDPVVDHAPTVSGPFDSLGSPHRSDPR